MGHLPGLIADLALILIVGAITTILFRAIRQPLVLGYIIAGFLVGPYLSLTPTVTDSANVKIWADIGVIFLLFSLGLEFSFRKLRRVGGAASITAVVEIVFIMLAGYLLGTLMGWSVMNSLFLGGMLASSSTTIISKAFDELGIKTKNYVRIVIGVLIIEDLVVIILMVLLSTIAVTKEIEGTEVLFTILKLMFFLILWFIAGIFLIPTVLKNTKKLLNEETLLVLSVGLCLGMVVLATQAGFSAELGAFIMGSILAETTAAEKIEHLTKPVKDLFGAVFFVSVGMMIDPATIIEYRWPILWITMLVLLGKLFSTAGGSLISGQPLKQSLQVGMSMAQVGEFAFIVASLGLSLGVTSDFLFPVAVGVSAITTFTTPYLIKYSSGSYDFLVRFLPVRWISALNNYSSGTRKIQAESKWKKVINGYLTIIITNGIIILAIFLIALNFFLPFINKHIANEITSGMVVLVVSLGVATPFIWALIAKRPNNMAYKELWVEKKYSHGPLLILEISRIMISLILTGFLLDRLFSTSTAFFAVLPVIIIAFILFSKRTKKFYDRLESRFISNLNAREASELKGTASKDFLLNQLNLQPDLMLWDAHLADMEVSRHATYIGKTLGELAWREKFGINIACIRRGEKLIFAPGKNDMLFALDHVSIIGTDEQIQAFKPIFEASEHFEPADNITNDLILRSILVNEQNKLKGQTIRSSGIRENTKGLVIGIQRENTRILNPDSDTVFEWGDLVWIAGEREKIQNLNEGNTGKPF